MNSRRVSVLNPSSRFPGAARLDAYTCSGRHEVVAPVTDLYRVLSEGLSGGSSRLSLLRMAGRAMEATEVMFCRAERGVVEDGTAAGSGLRSRRWSL